jgi:thiamine-phosphate pyrophosphorylase
VTILAKRYPELNFPPVILMTDEDRLADPSDVLSFLPQGSAVILRYKNSDNRRRMARRLIVSCRALKIRLLISDDVRLATIIGADGVHLPERALCALPTWRLWRRPGWLVTAAAHSPAALWRAKRAGADAALLSPVFETLSHPDRRPLGLRRFAMMGETSPLPVYALGGITPSTLLRLNACRIVGIAGIGGIVPLSSPTQ